MIRSDSVRDYRSRGRREFGIATRVVLTTCFRKALVPVHFGLGSDTVVDLTITWPNGIVQVLDNVSADQVLRVTETAP